MSLEPTFGYRTSAEDARERPWCPDLDVVDVQNSVPGRDENNRELRLLF